MIKIWIGRRESDVLTYKPVYFDYSITYYGSNKNHNYAFSYKNRNLVSYDENFMNFVDKTINIIMQNKCQDFELHFYSNMIKTRLIQHNKAYEKYCKNCNDSRIINWLDNKTYTRLWLSNSIKVPEFKLLSKSECSYENLKSLFFNQNKFVLQLNYSAGGDGTFRLEETNKDNINSLSPCYPYLVSPYYEPSISACCHVIIGKEENIIFPLGEQIISKYNNRLSYAGTKYDLEKRLDDKTKEKCYSFIEIISNLLSRNGFRGICGYDFLIYNNEPFFIEINPRYMGSSYLINHILSVNGLPSLFELNTFAFQNKSLKKYKEKISTLKTNYVTHTVHSQEEITDIKSFNLVNSDYLFLDGLTRANKIDRNVLLYRYFQEM